MGKEKCTNSYRTRKRKFCRNQFTKEGKNEQDNVLEPLGLRDDVVGPSPKSSDVSSKEVECSSAKNLKLYIDDMNSDRDDYYILMSFPVLKNMIEAWSRCPKCHHGLLLEDDNICRAGLSPKLLLTCASCEWTSTFHSSELIQKQQNSGAKRRAFDVNMRSVIAFREIGKGHEAMKCFSGFMNLSPPVTRKQYNKVNVKLHSAYQDVANLACKRAKEELCKSEEGDSASSVAHCEISIDGTWQKRGHVPLNGVITAVSRASGYCLDFEDFVEDM